MHLIFSGAVHDAPGGQGADKAGDVVAVHEQAVVAANGHQTGVVPGGTATLSRSLEGVSHEGIAR